MGKLSAPSASDRESSRKLHRARHLIRENLGFKIGLLSGSAILLVVLLLVLIFGSIHIPLISKLSLIQILLVLGLFMAAISLLVISVATNVMIQRPLARLMKAIHRAERGNLKTRARVQSRDEIGQLATQFNEMLAKIEGLEKTKLKAEHELTTAQEELRYKGLLEEKAAVITSTNRRLEESLRELSILFNISQTMTCSIDPEELCNKLSEVVKKNMEVDDFAILLLNEATQKLEVKAAIGFRRKEEVRSLCFDLGEGISGQVAKSQEAVYIADTQKDSEYLHYKGAKAEQGAFLSIPIVAKQKTLGVINFSRHQVDGFTSQEVHMLKAIAGQLAIALENASLYAKTKELSLIDELTQVYNRRHFQVILDMEFKRAQRFHRSLSLLMIDVDHFKRFNDTFGHVEGDRLLIKMAGGLKENLREVDTVARYGGEEFAVILPNTNLEEASQVGEKLRSLIENLSIDWMPFRRRRLTISVGVASFPEQMESVEALVDDADIALYQAKAGGRNRVETYQKDLKEKTAKKRPQQLRILS